MSLELRLEGVYTDNRESLAENFKVGFAVCRKLGVDVRITLFRSVVDTDLGTHKVTKAHSVVLPQSLAFGEPPALSSEIEKLCNTFVEALKQTRLT